MHFGPFILAISFLLKASFNKHITFIKLIVILSTFSVIGVINIGMLGIGIDKAIAYIMILLFFIDRLNKQSIKLKKKAFIYSLIVILAILLPLVNDIEIERYFIAPSGITSELTASFSTSSVIKSLEMIFPIVFFALILSLAKSDRAISIYNSLYISVLVVSLTGLADYTPFAVDIWTIIKTNISYPTVVGGVTTETGNFRLSGLTAEPSHLVVFATIGLNMTIINLLNKTVKFRDILLFCLFLYISIKTYSPSFYLLLMPTIYYIWYKNKLIIYKILILLVSFFIVLIAYLTGYIDLMINDMLVRLGAASIENSSQLRTLSHMYAFDVFVNNPILGVGFGNFLLPVGFPTLVLASTGLVGFSVMCFLFIKYIQYAKKSYINYYMEDMYIWHGFFINAIGLILMGITTKGFQIFLHVPYIIILALPLCRFKQLSKPVSNLNLRLNK